MKGYALGKDIQEIKDRLSAIEGQLSRPKQPCKACSSPTTPRNGKVPSLVRFPRWAKVWIQLGDCLKENAGDPRENGRVVLRSKSGVAIEVSTNDVEASNGTTLLRNGAQIYNFSKLNPELKPKASCEDYYYPNECYFNDTSCAVVVLICHYCCYDENGFYKGEKSEVCGACVEGPFHK